MIAPLNYRNELGRMPGLLRAAFRVGFVGEWAQISRAIKHVWRNVMRISPPSLSTTWRLCMLEEAI
jgi:hypothetical protein